MLIDKAALLQEIRTKTEQEIAVLVQAAKAAHEAATHEESTAEDAHDTRSVELSYLAGAQAQRVAELEQTLSYFRQIEFRDFHSKDPIELTAVVELNANGKKTLYLIAQHGGGMRVSVGGKTVLVITPLSPVGEELVGRRVGDCVEVEAQGSLRELKITAIA